MTQMARIETYQCDVCQATKAESNHWWRVWVMHEHKVAIVLPLASKITVPLSGPAPGSGRISEYLEFHLCGQDCVLKKISEVMK